MEESITKDEELSADLLALFKWLKQHPSKMHLTSGETVYYRAVNYGEISYALTGITVYYSTQDRKPIVLFTPKSILDGSVRYRFTKTDEYGLERILIGAQSNVIQRYYGEQGQVAMIVNADILQGAEDDDKIPLMPPRWMLIRG